MRIAILCSDPNHPVYPFLQEWKTRHEGQHEIYLVQRKSELTGGDILFLISCHEIIGQDIRDAFNATLVIHASDLPLGRGWSPHIWQVLEGKNEIPVTLIEAEDNVDSGAIWTQIILRLEGHELAGEINDLLFQAELQLMDFAIDNSDTIAARQQDHTKSNYYRRRTPEDSRVDPNKSIAEQFDLIRVADPKRYPAFFDFRGHRYFLSIAKRPSHEHE